MRKSPNLLPKLCKLKALLGKMCCPLLDSENILFLASLGNNDIK